MNEQLMQIWNKVVENKSTVIKIGSAVLGALAGVVVASVVENAQISEKQKLADLVLSEDE